MSALFRSVSRLLLLVMLATVFSPSFGWDAVQGMTGHDHPAAGHAGHHDHDGHVHDAAAPRDGCGGECAAGAESCADTPHHCCPGHVFGHLLAGLGAGVSTAIAVGGAAVPVGSDSRFSSRIPDGLERPPRASAA